jgi:hypothetical protein
MQVWYDYGMYDCDHQLVAIVYGYMHGEMISQLNKHEIMYGGMRKSADSADWFCIRCLEDVFL